MTLHDSKSILAARRREFGAFLRSRRERLTPAGVGLPDGFRRRTPGLRREEVALLAGVGTTWYTWLEQGRDIRASTEVLTAIADVLKLDAAERRHLFILGDRLAAEARSPGPEEVSAPLLRMLASLAGQPAYVLGRRWDVLAWNPAATALFGDYALLEGDRRNSVHRVFTDPAHRQLLVDWETVAANSLAMFRADSARYAGDPDFERLIATLKTKSPEFRAWWSRHDVLRPLAGHKRLRHPDAGPMTFEYTALAVTDGQDMKLVVYTPLDEDGTAEKLARLLDGTAATPPR